MVAGGRGGGGGGVCRPANSNQRGRRGGSDEHAQGPLPDFIGQKAASAAVNPKFLSIRYG